MAAPDRRTREKQQVLDRIIEAARRLFVRHGYEAVSMRKIAEAIEYTPAALYVYFKDKTELMREMCHRDFAALTARTLELAGEPDPVVRIYKIGAAYIRFGLEHPNHYQMMFMSAHAAELEPTEDDLKRCGDPTQDGYAYFRMTVQEAIEQGRMREDSGDLHLAAQTFWAAVHGVTALQITHAEDPWVTWRPIEKRIEAMLGTVLRGMLRDPDDLDRSLARAAKRGASSKSKVVAAKGGKG